MGLDPTTSPLRQLTEGSYEPTVIHMTLGKGEYPLHYIYNKRN